MNRRIYAPRLGSISHGTMRPVDLIETFAWEIKRSKLTAAERDLVRRAYRWLNLPANAQSAAADVGDNILCELFDVLDAYAPAYCYFGAHEGDGSDYGFWPSMDAIDGLPRVEGADDARRLMEDCRFVNDHGNVTVFDGRGRVIIDFV